MEKHIAEPEEALLRDLVQITVDDPTFRRDFGVSLSRDDILNVTGVLQQFMYYTFVTLLHSTEPGQGALAYAEQDEVRSIVIDSLKVFLRPLPSSSNKSASKQAAKGQGTLLTNADRERLTCSAMKLSLALMTKQRIAEAAYNLHQQARFGFKNEPYKSKVEAWRDCMKFNHFKDARIVAFAAEGFLKASNKIVAEE